MPNADPAEVLALLRDPNVDSQELAEKTGEPREAAARAARLVVGIAKAKPEDVCSLPGPLASAVAQAALQNGRADVLAALANHPSRDTAKEAKRGLHLLRSRGVAVPEVARPAPPQAPAAPEPSFSCYASGVDGEGERVIWISRSVPGRGVEMGQAIVSDTQGLTELQVALLGRKEYRAFGQDVFEKGRSMGVAEISRELAKSLVAAARRLNDASGKRVPEGADAWLARLGQAVPLENPAGGFPSLPEEEERAAVRDSGQLHQAPSMRGWLAEEEFLRRLAHKLEEIEVSPLYVDERQRAEQVARTIGSAVDDYLDEPRRQRLATRLFSAAAQLVLLGDGASARLAGAAARAVATGLPGSSIPFVRLLIEKAFPPPPESPPAEKPGGDQPLIIAPR
jgi:hypothetical protein